MPPERPAAVFFDFDGIIVDTEWAIYDAWRDLYVEHGHLLPLETYNQCIGTDFNTWSPKAHLEDLTGNSFDWHQLDGTRNAEIRKTLEGSPAMPGIPEALAAAREAGCQLAVVSSSSHNSVDGWLRTLGLFEQFETTVCRGDAPRIKPASDLYLEAARRLGRDPAACLVIEDSINGLAAARDAGMQTVAIPNRITSCCDFSAAGVVLSSGEDLMDMFVSRVGGD